MKQEDECPALSFLASKSPDRGSDPNRAIGIVRKTVAYQGAGIQGAVVRNRKRVIRGHDIHVEIDQPFAGEVGACSAHAVGGVAYRTAKACIDVGAVLVPARVLQNLICYIVAFTAQRIRPVDARVGIGKEIADQLAWCGRLAELILALQNVGPLGTVRTVRTGAAELPIVVAVVAIGAKNLGAHGAALGNAVEVQHAGPQAGLRESAAAGMCDRMARGGSRRKLRNNIQRIARRYCAHRKISKNWQHLLAGAGAMAAQAVLILIYGGGKHGDSGGGADGS